MKTFSFVLLIAAVATGFYLRAADAPSRVQLNIDRAGPREVEEQTQRSIARDYSAAWTAMENALEQNDPAALGELWVGYGRQKIADAIDQQQQSGLRVRYVDHGHKLDAVFYSPEGSALELHDTAQIEMQLLDGSTVVHSEDLTAHYLVVMTPTSDHWQVRMLQEVAGF